MSPRQFVRGLPKAELHLHIEGSLEPEMVFALANKHGAPLRYPSVEALRAAYDFSDLQSFLDIYYEGAAVLRDADDFHALTLAYLKKAHADGVVHAEIFCDPQTHTARGVPMRQVLRSEEHTSELQSLRHLVCRLLLEKKKKKLKQQRQKNQNKID